MALVSGGKDSFFNIHHCLSQGHELIALANLYPPKAQDNDEIDSFMFQTVGHDVIDYYSQCLDVPLYRQEISGKSANQDLEYSITMNDEIEDLYQLLARVKEIHPEVRGVSCGAILSHYQRTRVENVCERLGLVSLTYLWQRDQMELMGEMCANGLDARLIKVAAIGLNEKHLGKSISEMYPILIKLNAMYQVHICGEGGEFETLVLDSPIFKKFKLEIKEQQIIQHSNDDVYYLRLKLNLVPKEESSLPTLGRPILNAFSEEALEHIDKVSPIQVPNVSLLSLEVQAATTTNYEPCYKVVTTKRRVYINNLVSSASGGIVEQASEIFNKLKTILDENGVTFNDIQHVNMLLKDMSEFGQINKTYHTRFAGLFLPPSRICISTTLGSHDLQLSCVVLKNKGRKQGTHIRSISYWAPHNIGPYSQVRVDEVEKYKLATISGQIPLIPSLMELETTRDHFRESILALQHLDSVRKIVDIDEWAFIIGFITPEFPIDVALSTSKAYFEEYDGSLMDRMVIVTVPALPRGARVEWGAQAFSNKVSMYENDDGEDEEDPIDSQKGELIIGSKDCQMKLGVYFTNDFEQIKNIAVAGQYQQVFTPYENTLQFKDFDFDLLPVFGVYDSMGTHYKYCVIQKVEYN